MNDGLANCTGGEYEITKCPTGLVYVLIVHLSGTRVVLTVVQVSRISTAGLQWDLHQLYDCEGKHHAHSRDRGGLYTT